MIAERKMKRTELSKSKNCMDSNHGAEDFLKVKHLCSGNSWLPMVMCRTPPVLSPYSWLLMVGMVMDSSLYIHKYMAKAMKVWHLPFQSLCCAVALSSCPFRPPCVSSCCFLCSIFVLVSAVILGCIDARH